jgi:hypothetical protein
LIVLNNGIADSPKLALKQPCPLWVKSGHSAPVGPMSAKRQKRISGGACDFGPKAKVRAKLIVAGSGLVEYQSAKKRRDREALRIPFARWVSFFREILSEHHLVF